jgi:hypothetical protein
LEKNWSISIEIPLATFHFNASRAMLVSISKFLGGNVMSFKGNDEWAKRWQHEHGPGIDFRSISSLESKGKYLFVDRGKLMSMKSYEKMGR